MGSLLDDMMSVWDSAKLNLGISDLLETTPEEADESEMTEEDSQTLLEGEDIDHCNGDASLSRSTNSVGEESRVAVGPEEDANEMAAVHKKRASRGEEEEEDELGAVGGASSAGALIVSGKKSEGGLLSGNIIIKESISKPTKTYRKVPSRQVPESAHEGELGGGVNKPEPQTQEEPRSRPGRDINLMRQLSREKRWDNEFRRLSSPPKEKSQNDYIETNKLQEGESRSNEEYEELALASSPQPYTLRDNVLDSANVMRGPRYGDVTRSISLRTERPSLESYTGHSEAELNRSRSLREPPVSPLGQQAYDSLIGGEISSNSRRVGAEASTRRAPAVPPKPAPKPLSRTKTADAALGPVRLGEGRFRNDEARISGASSHRSYSGTSSDDGVSEDATIQNVMGNYAGQRGAVASLRQRFNSMPLDSSPPRVPPRETDSGFQRSVEHTKVSSYSGVRLRGQDHAWSDQSNGNGSFYAEHENNNAYAKEAKLSPSTLQNLEHHMPRRTRRSIGEDRIKRRNSSDGSDSDTEAPRGRTERGWSMSSRASEGDSSSDETLSSNRLSASSSERNSFSENRSSGYRSPPRPLYDLPEDQSEIILL